MNLADLLPQIEHIARQSGDLINKIYLGGKFEQHIKADNTPVTSADYAAHEFIIKALTDLTPDIPVLSEEDCDIPLSIRSVWPAYWLVDPLDGTQEFVAKSGDFSTSIALIQDHKPVLGVIYAPVHNLLYSAIDGQGASKVLNGQRSQIAINKHSKPSPTKMVIAMSRVQKTQWITDLLTANIQYEFVVLGSSTLKSCLVAEGGADCYIRVGPTGEWDTGAAQCILTEAGGKILDLTLTPLSYNQRESLENPNFISLGDPNLDWQAILTSHN